MSLRHSLALAGLGALALAVLSGSAQANPFDGLTPNANQARASERISVFERPRNQTNEIIGMLQANEIVTIQRCTTDGNWCRVFSDQPVGWVPASYLVGSPAKANTTPLSSLTNSAIAVGAQRPSRR